jgi:drug/metabolite transporter (DMT)-like permease
MRGAVCRSDRTLTHSYRQTYRHNLDRQLQCHSIESGSSFLCRRKMTSALVAATPSFMSSKPRLLASVAVLLLIVVLWVAMAEVAQAMQSGCGQGDNKPYHKPYAVTFVIHVGYTLCLVVAVAWTAVEHMLERRQRRGAVSDDVLSPAAVNWKAWQWILLKCALLGLYTNLIGYTYYRSLPLISVSANVAIYNSAGAFVYVFTLLLRMERFNWLKVLALAISVGGVCLVQFLSTPLAAMPCPGDDPTPTPAAVSGATEGYVLVVISTITYASYEVIYKRWLPPSVYRAASVPLGAAAAAAAAAGDGESDEQTSLLPVNHTDSSGKKAPEAAAGASMWSDVKFSFMTLGLIGLFHSLLNWPGLLILDATGVETFELPEARAGESLMVTMVMDSAFNVLLLIGIALTSPLFISVGSLLTIPASILSDWLVHGRVMDGGALGGVAMIAVGFLLLTFAERREHKQLAAAAAATTSKAA